MNATIALNGLNMEEKQVKTTTKGKNFAANDIGLTSAGATAIARI